MPAFPSLARSDGHADSVTLACAGHAVAVLPLMARPKLPGVPPVLLVALVLVMPQPGIASNQKQPAEPSTTSSRFPPLLDCGPAAESDGAFGANVLSLLRDIPSVAASAPAGFAAGRSRMAGRDRAFARALCFGAANRSSSSAAGCRACLSAAASDATSGCGGSRRAGVWRAGCFLGYADTDAASAREDAFLGWFYTSPNTPAAATLGDRVCTGDRTGPDCARCFEDAARAAAALPWLVRMRGEEVIVVGYACCLRVRISVLPLPAKGSDSMDIHIPRRALSFLWMAFMLVTELLTVTELLILISIALRGIPQAIQ